MACGVVGHEHPGRLELGRQLTRPDEHRRLLAHLGAGERLALARDVVHPVVERPLGGTERGRREVVRERGTEREAEERRRVERGARRGPRADLPRVDAPVVGDEGVGDDRGCSTRCRACPRSSSRRRPRSPPAGRAPTPASASRRGPPAAARCRASPSERGSNRSRTASAPGRRYPPSTCSNVPSVAANDDDIITLGSSPHISSCACCGKRHTSQKWLAMRPNTQPGRRVALGDLGDDLDRGLGAELGATPVRRLVDAHQAAGDELLHGGVGDAAQRLGLGPPVDEVGGELAGAGHRAPRG